jgi:hypothetical protein
MTRHAWGVERDRQSTPRSSRWFMASIWPVGSLRDPRGESRLGARGPPLVLELRPYRPDNRLSPDRVGAEDGVDANGFDANRFDANGFDANRFDAIAAGTHRFHAVGTHTDGAHGDAPDPHSEPASGSRPHGAHSVACARERAHADPGALARRRNLVASPVGSRRWQLIAIPYVIVTVRDAGIGRLVRGLRVRCRHGLDGLRSIIDGGAGSSRRGRRRRRARVGCGNWRTPAFARQAPPPRLAPAGLPVRTRSSGDQGARPTIRRRPETRLRPAAGGADSARDPKTGGCDRAAGDGRPHPGVCRGDVRQPVGIDANRSKSRAGCAGRHGQPGHGDGIRPIAGRGLEDPSDTRSRVAAKGWSAASAFRPQPQDSDDHATA